MSKSKYVVDQVDDDMWIIFKSSPPDEWSLEQCKEFAAKAIAQRIAEHQELINHLRDQLDEINALTESDIEDQEMN